MDGQPPSATTVLLDDLRIDLHERRVIRGAQVLAVTSRSFELLRLLIEHYPAIASPREIIAGVWPGLVVSADALTQRVKLLRRQLGGNAERYVVNVHGVGYRLSVAPTHARRADTASAVSRRRRLARPLLAAAAALLAVAVAAGAFVYDAPHAIKHALKHHLGGSRSPN